MATVVEETRRSGGIGSRTRSYAVWGESSESAAMGALLTHLSGELGAFLILDGLALRSLDYDEEVAGVYKFKAGWGEVGRPEPAETNSFSITFDFAAEAQKVVLPVNAILVYDADGEVTDAAAKPQLIGDAGDGEKPEGVEVFEPKLSFSETHYKPSDFVDNDYLRLLRTLIGRTNSEEWRGFEVGELIATGVSGSRRSVRDDWELQFKFVAGEHQEDLEIAGITIPVKHAWDYLWPRLGWKFDTLTWTTKRNVRQICLTNPFRSADYTLFGIDP